MMARSPPEFQGRGVWEIWVMWKGNCGKTETHIKDTIE
jgi:hypothetical protein